MMRAGLVAALAVAALTVPSVTDAAPVRDRTPRCQFEDGPGRCVWDARHMGNGAGDSLVIRRDGSVRFVSHRRAHKLATTSR